MSPERRLLKRLKRQERNDDIEKGLRLFTKLTRVYCQFFSSFHERVISLMNPLAGKK